MRTTITIEQQLFTLAVSFAKNKRQTLSQYISAVISNDLAKVFAYKIRYYYQDGATEELTELYNNEMLNKSVASSFEELIKNNSFLVGFEVYKNDTLEYNQWKHLVYKQLSSPVPYREDNLIMTLQGVNNLVAELEHLRCAVRTEISNSIKCLNFVNLCEDKEYLDIKEKQSIIESRIKELELILSKAVISMNNPLEVINVGTTVSCMNDEGKPTTFQIVGATEADPVNYKISYLSPVGNALIGCKAGDVVNVALPHGRKAYRIIAVSNA